MVITKNQPFTKEEIIKLKEQMNNKVVLAALASDLKRVSLGLEKNRSFN